ELNNEILALGVAQLAQSLFKGLKYPCRARITGRQYSDPGNFSRLSFNSERRENETDSENDREPDPPHTHLGGGWLAGVYQRTAGRRSHAASYGLTSRCQRSSSTVQPFCFTLTQRRATPHTFPGIL